MNAGLRIETPSGAKWRDAVAHRELPIFFLLAFLRSWYPWFLALAQGRTSGPNPLGPFVAARASGTCSRGLFNGNAFVAFWYLYALLWLSAAVLVFTSKSARSKIGPAGQ